MESLITFQQHTWEIKVDMKCQPVSESLVITMSQGKLKLTDIKLWHKDKKIITRSAAAFLRQRLIGDSLDINFQSLNSVKSRYLELGYLEFCKTQRVFLITFSNHNLAFGNFFTSPNYPKCKSICTLGNLNL